jgi:GTP-binding protein
MGLGRADLSFTVLRAVDVPEAQRPRWAVVGRSNVGKSSLLNALIHPQTLFRTGKTPGVTRGLIGARLWMGKSEESVLEIVDCPGYGFAKLGDSVMEQWQELLEALKSSSHEKGLQWIWLVDPQRQPGDLEVLMLQWLGQEPFSLIFTKADLVGKTKRVLTETAWKKWIAASSESPLWVSSKSAEGMMDLQKRAKSFVRFRSSL